jgi:hypothetical protein
LRHLPGFEDQSDQKKTRQQAVAGRDTSDSGGRCGGGAPATQLGLGFGFAWNEHTESETNPDDTHDTHDTHTTAHTHTHVPPTILPMKPLREAPTSMT